MPSGGLHRRIHRRKLYFLLLACPCCHWQVHLSCCCGFHIPALGPTSLGLQCGLKTNCDIQSCELRDPWPYPSGDVIVGLYDHSLSVTQINSNSGSAGTMGSHKFRLWCCHGVRTGMSIPPLSGPGTWHMYERACPFHHIVAPEHGICMNGHVHSTI